MKETGSAWGDRTRRVLGSTVARHLGAYRRRLSAVEDMARTLAVLGDDSLVDCARNLRLTVDNGAPPGEIQVELFAVIAEACRRHLGLTPHPEQIVAGLAMADGQLVEMQTGEGKTMAAVAPVALRAFSGLGAHVLTVNDYLAARDAEWMGPVYRTVGLEVASINELSDWRHRQQAYAADVTYLTAKESGFDFLRDHLCLDPGQIVHRPFHFALVDEADSILIDEARIPLVIAGYMDAPPTLATKAAKLVTGLMPGVDCDTDEHGRNISLTTHGARHLEANLGCGNLYEPRNLELLTEIRNALHARHLLKRDVDYIVRDGRVELVDDFTGRVADKRQWPDGLQAAIEAKEKLELQKEGRILGSLTMQHFLLNYPSLTGMTATAVPAAEELAAFYDLRVVVIPSHEPCQRLDHDPVIFTHRAAKQQAVVAEISAVHAKGRPVLVGTASVRESEELAAALALAGVNADVLNAKNDEQEAEIVARAGAIGAVTISTNMAGRGTDIRLGGPDETDHDEVAAMGGLDVIGTNLHESRRIDLQLRGRAGRQGDPGSSRFFISLEDPLIERYGVRDLIPRKRLPEPQDEPIEDSAVLIEIERAQRIIEGEHFAIRQRLWSYADLVENQRKDVLQRRLEVLEGRATLELLERRCPKRWFELLQVVSLEEARKVEQRLTLLAMDRCWCDHLALINGIRDGIHVVGFVGKEPLAEFKRESTEAFAELDELVEQETIATFEALAITHRGVDWSQGALHGPSSTWTYLVTDDGFGSNAMRSLANRAGFAAIASMVAGPFLMLWSLLLHRKRRRLRQRLGMGSPEE